METVFFSSGMISLFKLMSNRPPPMICNLLFNGKTSFAEASIYIWTGAIAFLWIFRTRRAHPFGCRSWHMWTRAITERTWWTTANQILIIGLIS